MLVKGPGDTGREVGVPGTDRVGGGVDGVLMTPAMTAVAVVRHGLGVGSEFRCTLKLNDLRTDWTGAVRATSSPSADRAVTSADRVVTSVADRPAALAGVQEPSFRLVGGVRELSPILRALRGLEGREEARRSEALSLRTRSRLERRSVARWNKAAAPIRDLNGVLKNCE